MEVKPQLSVYGRWLLVQRVMSGRPVAHVAAELGVSRATGYKWWRRWREEGAAGLHSRSSCPRTSPTKTPDDVEQQVLALRRERRLGLARIAGILGLPSSTAHRILTRHGMPRLTWWDRPTGEPVRRYERTRPGELVHVDVKKLGAIRPGGGWRAHGRGSAQNSFSRAETGAGRRVGYDYVHCAVDDHTRLAYAEIHADEKAVTCAGFLRRAAAWFAEHGITRIERVMTDNAKAYRISHAWQQALADIGAAPRFTRPYRPQTNCEGVDVLLRAA